MIDGAHVILYSTDPEGDRAFLRDVLGLPHVDAGDGWLIFALPPAEVAVHPSDRNDVHELYLTCADVGVLIAAMKQRGVRCGPVEEQGWGLLTRVSLPGGGKLGIYEPRHARPKPVRARKAPRSSPARGRKVSAAPGPARKAPRKKTGRR
jgi:hypothetical protein